jgi:3-polyprenyl-4-hydroxybenzoate decarboxylase
MKYIVAITDASGVIIGKTIAEYLSCKNLVYAIVSNSAKTVAKYELGPEDLLKESKILRFSEKRK